jgi:hypothetical protein
MRPTCGTPAASRCAGRERPPSMRRMTRPLLPRQTRYDYHPLPERKDYSWPGGKRLAFVLTTNIECFAFGAGNGHDPAKTGEPQTHRNYSWRDYGNRIGIWRFFELFDELAPARRAQRQQPAVRLRAAGDGRDPPARRRDRGPRPHQRREPPRHVGGRRGTHHPGRRRHLRQARRQGADRLDGIGRVRDGLDARPAEGSRLQVPDGLADGRPAGVDAHPQRPHPVGALPDRAERFAGDHAPQAGRQPTSATWSCSSSTRWPSNASGIRW